MSGTMLYKPRLCSQVPTRNCQDSSQRNILLFLNDEEFVSRTINDSNNDSNKSPASKVCQIAKRMESPKTTAKHIKQVASDPQVVQVNLLQHHHTEILPSQSNKKTRTFKFRQEANMFNEYKPRMLQANKRRFHSECTRPERHPKCGDSQHREGFRCPASKHQCKICHKFGHFSSLCYKKRDGLHNPKRSLGSPRAHQLKIGFICTQDSLSGESDGYSSEEDSFCLQLQVQSTQPETSFIAPQHLFTNLKYKLTPQKKRTKFLRSRIDTCTNVNLMPISIYQLLYKGSDCKKIAPSNKCTVKTYSTEKIQIVGSCDLFVLHPDTKCLMVVAFQVTSHEGSVIVSCATSFELGLIQPHRDFNVVPDIGSLIYSKADPPVKQKYKKSAPVSKLSNNVCSREVEPLPVSRVQETEVFQCVNQDVQAKCKQQQCQSTIFWQELSRNQTWPYVDNAVNKGKLSYTQSMPRPVKLQSPSKQKCPVRQQYVCHGKQRQCIKCIKSEYGDQKCPIYNVFWQELSRN